jgi:protein tyrosine phosphatase (PTP) superfamily phosphohydrolase (DUF442 family)
MSHQRRFFLYAVSTWLVVSSPVFSQALELRAPNVVAISPTLVTSGQPSAEALAGLSRAGFQAVIYLAPSTVSDAVAAEPEILRRQGIEFIHIPIPFGKPEEHHFVAAAEALSRLASKKVLVHCQVNMRASVIVFLYRTIKQKQSPPLAYESVAKVWSPEGPWRELLVAQLRKHAVDFQPY